MSPFTALLLARVFCAGPLDDLDALQSPSASDSNLRVEVRGKLSLEGRVYVQDRAKTEARDQQLLTEARATVELEWGTSWKAHLVPWLLLDALDPKLLRYEPLEAYLLYRAESWDALAGQFIENWGVADVFNPMAVLNRVDLGPDLVHGVPRGELGARLRWFGEGGDVVGEPTISLYALPLWRPTELPTSRNRFEFRGLVPAEAPGLGEGVFAAARFESTLTTPTFNADIQLLAARGPERLFAVLPDTDGLPHASYYGTWTLGGGLRALPNAPEWSQFTLKAEVALKLPYHLATSTQIPVRHLQYVLGVDRTFGSLFATGDTFILTLEWLGEVGRDHPLNYLRPFRSDIAIRLAWDANDFARSHLRVLVILDARNGETIAELSLGRTLSIAGQPFVFELSGRWLRPAPAEATLLASFPARNSDIRAQVAWSF